MNASSPDIHIADARPMNWVERRLPALAIPYAQLMRLDRPIGWWLLLLPCWWGLALAIIPLSPQVIHIWYAFLFLIGAIIMRGAGCVLNDLADRDFDGKVERTKNRPLPSGRVTPIQASIFLGLLLLLGLVILLQFNWFTVATGMASLAIVAVYPFMKRITHWPQAVLGLAFNWGALLGWSAIQCELSPAALLLYGGGVVWTLAYDTIYAHQDKEDDVLIGVKSTALMFGSSTKPWLMAFFTLAFTFLALAVQQAGGSILAYGGLVAAALHAIWQCQRFDGNDSAQCLKLFKSNRTLGLLVLLGFLLDGIFS